MSGKNKFQIALSGAVLCGLALGFSDTARAQSVTISEGGQTLSGPLTFTVVSGTLSQAQTLNIATPPNNGNSLVVTVPQNYASWLKVNPGAIADTPGNLLVQVDATSVAVGTLAGSFTVEILNNPSSTQTVTVNATVTGTSALSASPASLNFAAQAGTNFGTPQNCALENSSSTCQVTILSTAGPLAYNVSTTPGNSWLQVDQYSGSTSGIPMNVGVNASTLTPGQYSGQILVQSTTTSDAVTISVSLTVTSTATLTASPMQLNFYYTAGNSNPAPQQVTVSSSGSAAAFNVTQSPDSNWLHVTPINSSASSTSPAILTVSVTPGSPTALAPGAYSSTVTIGTATVNVSLVVSNNPFLTVTSQMLAFSAQFGGTSPAVQGITVGSTGAALNFTASATSNAGWLTVSPSSGTTGAASAAVSAGVNQAVLSTLALGNYTGTVTIVPANGDPYSIKIPVTLTVGASSTIYAAPSSLVFSDQSGQNQPGAQTIQLLASGPDLGFTLSTSVSSSGASCGTANWLSAAAQQSPVTTPNVLIVSVNTAGMTAGSCYGTVKVAYNGTSGGAELDIPVTLFVSASPLLTVSLPQGFGLISTPVQTNAATGLIQQQITVASTDGTAVIPYSVSYISAPCNWLAAGPTTGGTNGSTPTPIGVQITPGCIVTPGIYPGSVTISSNTGLPTPVTFNITLIVTSNVSAFVTPQGLTFNQTQGGPAPAAQPLKFTVSGGNTNFVATAQSDFGWLSVTPTSGSTSLGTISAAVGTNTLPQGTYNGVISINFQNAETPSATVKVQLIVGPSQTLTAGASSLTFSYQLNGPAPASQPLTLTSMGGAAAFTVGTTSNGGWLNVDTASGTTGTSGSQTINVSVDPTKIPSGTAAGAQLQGSLTISAPGVLATPVTVNVTLNVTAAAVPQLVTIANSAVINGYGAIAPGEIIAIHGNNLGPATAASFTVANNAVNSTLSGVQVLFDTIAGTPMYVSPTQINVIVPWEIAGRTTTNIVVSYNGTLSTAIPVQVTTVAPGIYTQDATGSGQAAAVNLSSAAASVYNGPAGGTYAGTNLPTAPAPQGSYVSFYLTGGGSTNPGSVTGSINPSATLLPLQNWAAGSGMVTATIGNQPATVQFAGAAPSLINGAVQVNLQVPMGVSGNALPVVITIDGVTTQATATIAVQ